MEKELKISFRGYWFIGSGHEAGAYADSLMLKDPSGLPYIPGKTIKGIFRNAARIAEANGLIDRVNELFGVEGTTITGKVVINKNRNQDGNNDTISGSEEDTAGILCFSNAELPYTDRRIITEKHAQKYLFRTIQNTKIDRTTGSAAKGSLRTVEVCVPLDLVCSISYEDTQIASWKNFQEQLKLICCLIGEIGGKRRRGFGKCTVEVID